MGRPQRMFLHFLTDVSGNCYAVVDGQVTTVANKWLNHSPKEWRDQTLSWGRNNIYYGLDRTYTDAYSFVEDGAQILRYLMYGRSGVEELVFLVVLKWNPDTDVYEDYYKCEVDLSQMQDSVESDFKVNLIEGGLVKLIKAYDNTQFSIPMDGSLPEHYKVNVSGILFDDVFHYTFVPFTFLPEHAVSASADLPLVFVGNDGDNIGIIHGDPTFDEFSDTDGTHQNTSANYIYQPSEDTEVTIKGFIVVKPSTNKQSILALSCMLGSPYDITQPGLDLILTQDITAQKAIYFNTTFLVQANQKIFITGFNQDGDNPTSIVGGSLDIIFSSKYKDTQVWCMSAYDFLGYLLKNICNYASSNDGEIYNYGFQSELLSQFLGFSITSGDAIRSSGDPQFVKYFNPVTQLGAQVNNYFTSYGPTAKSSLREFFTSMNVILNACLGTEYDTDGNLVMFLEDKNKVFDSSSIDMDLNEVSELKVSLAQQYIFDILKIGYAPQTYDEKAGKYEYNITLQMRSVIKRIQQELSLICPIRTDSYGIEYTRFNSTKDSKSTTYNNSDQSVFLLNADITSIFSDTDKVNVAVNPGPNGFPLKIGEGGQDVPFSEQTGNYWQVHTDNAMFVSNSLPSASYLISLTFAGTISGAQLDPGTNTKAYANVDFILNGVIIASRQWFVSATSPYIGGSVTGDTFSFNQVINPTDLWYIRVSSTPTCQVIFNDNTEMNIGSGAFTAQLIGTTTIAPGTHHQPIAFDECLPDVTAPNPTIRTGMTYLTFNDSLANKNFNYTARDIIEANSSSSGSNLGFALYVQGKIAFSVVHAANIGTSSSFTDNFASIAPAVFDFNDVVLALALCEAGTTGLMTYAEFVITSAATPTIPAIKVYELAREDYDYVIGIPNATTAYNIKDLTPKRILERHGNYIRSALFQQQAQPLKYLSLDKNENLMTSLDGVIISERSDEIVADFAEPLFYPYIFDFKTTIQDSFTNLMQSSVNAHITFTYNKVRFYGFPIKCSIQPGSEESQQWQLLASPMNDLTDLFDLSINGLNYLQLMTFGITVAHLNPIQFVPITTVIDQRYNNRNMDSDWYINQIDRWSSKRNYFQKWQTNDTINFQLISNGAAPASVSIIDYTGKAIDTIAMTQVSTTGLTSPYILFQVSIPLNSYPEGTYYLIASVGAGSAISQLISEGIDLKVVHDDTILIEYTHSKNKQTVVFTEPSLPFTPNLRVEGSVIRFVPGMNSAHYEDEPADEFTIDGVPFRTFTLIIGGEYSPVPPYIADKVNRIFGLNTVLVDGTQYARSGDASMEATSFPGEAMQYWSMQIRQSNNLEASTITPDGSLEDNLFAIYNIETKSFGDLHSQVSSNIVQVEHVDET
jgi:hypothetical protein